MVKRGRKKGVLYPQYSQKILKTVEKYPGGSTHEIAKKSGMSWATTDKYLRNLRRSKKVKSRKVGKKTIWI